MLKDATRRRFAMIAAWSVDRLSRSLQTSWEPRVQFSRSLDCSAKPQRFGVLQNGQEVGVQHSGSNRVALSVFRRLADKATEKFLKEAIEGNLAEVQIGELAQQQGESEAVRSFGKQLATELRWLAANSRSTASSVMAHH